MTTTTLYQNYYNLTFIPITSNPNTSKSERLFVTTDILFTNAVAAIIASGVLVLNLRLNFIVVCAMESSKSYITVYNYKEKLGLTGKTVYFYGGNIGHAQDMMNIVRLAKNMQNEKNAHFVLVGAGDEVELVREAVKQEKFDNMTLLPSVSQDAFKQMLAEFDVGLFTLHKDHSTHYFPGKPLSYMVQELPILGSINAGNDLKETIEEAGAGLVTVNGEDEKLFKNALKLLDDNKRREMGNNARKLLESTFSVEIAANQILKSIS